MIKIELNIDDISLSDIPIIKMIYDYKLTFLIIFSDQVFRLTDKRWFGETQITISNWKNLSIEKYVSENPFEQNIQIDSTKGIETFSLIQKIECKKHLLSLRGFSKDSDSWLTYKFENCTCKVETNEILQ